MKTQSERERMAWRVGQGAAKRAENFDRHTKLNQESSSVAKLEWANISLGERLGHGGWSNVYEASISTFYNLDQDKDCNCSVVTDDTTSTSSSLEEENNSQEAATMCFALKRLKPSVMLSEKRFQTAANDLVLESKLLSRLRHDHIIRLHAIPEMPIELSCFDLQRGYFLLLDRLQDTLYDRIKIWRSEREHQQRMSFMSWRGSKRKGDLIGIKQRIESVAIPIVEAMRYLHRSGVIFRDLKPANIGFDYDGNVKLFDFGIAREVASDGRRMTSKCGSYRYMAPEVHKRMHYGLPADVYSFGILLWELCSLKKPFNDMDKLEYEYEVMSGGVRPKLKSWWPSHLTNMMQDCWGEDPSKRPTFDDIATILKSEFSSKMPFKKSAKDSSRHCSKQRSIVAKA